MMGDLVKKLIIADVSWHRPMGRPMFGWMEVARDREMESSKCKIIVNGSGRGPDVFSPRLWLSRRDGHGLGSTRQL